MSTGLPGSLVQVHYHNRPGGVSTVISRYADTFCRLTGACDDRNLVVCEASGDGGVERWPRAVHVAACGYHSFFSERSFVRKRDRIARGIERVLLGHGLRRPVCVIGHNLSLGKNIALSAAFADIAEQYGGRGSGLRFFSVIHDFAEEGRTRLLRGIHRLDGFGVPVWQYLYPGNGNVTFVALNTRNLRLLREAGLPARLLRNPLIRPAETAPLPARERGTVTEALSRLAQDAGTRFVPSLPTLLYPVRAISRKNVAEAILVACVLQKCNLLVGAAGTSARDRRFFDAVSRICRSRGVTVVLGVDGVVKYLRAVTLSESLEMLHRYADACITTSVAEGFGYALYEPWLYGKPVVGRRPDGIARTEGLDFSHLYRRFGIPVEWAPVGALARRYRIARERALGKAMDGTDAMVVERQFRKAYVVDGTIDFAALDQEWQLRVLNRVLGSPDDTALLPALQVNSLGASLETPNMKEYGTLVSRNRVRAQSMLLDSGFAERFGRIFLGGRSRSCRSGDGAIRAISKYFSVRGPAGLFLDT